MKSVVTSISAQFESATINYRDHFLRLYIAFNRWYIFATGAKTDRSAIEALKLRYVIWEEYLGGRVMAQLRSQMVLLSEYTQRYPLKMSAYWSGSVESKEDWKSLIEYWYQVRCIVVHGNTLQDQYVRLAYDTLSIYMVEIVSRMKRCFTAKDAVRLSELSALIDAGSPHSERYQAYRSKLYDKFLLSPKAHQVDMYSASKVATSL